VAGTGGCTWLLLLGGLRRYRIGSGSGFGGVQRLTYLQIGRWEEESVPSQSHNLATVELKAGMLSAVSCQMCLRGQYYFPPLLASHGPARPTILTSRKKLWEVSLERTLTS